MSAEMTANPEDLFSVAESTAVLRTPLPAEQDFPGIPLIRSRTASITGHPTRDGTPLGLNTHRGRETPVALEDEMRLRHVYIVGQTGTGKSTLLQHMILSDVEKGRGVCVLDPHGTLISSILQRMPAAREQDVIVVDPSDRGHIIPFNFLKLDSPDGPTYRAERDLLLDHLLEQLRRTYKTIPDAFGPMFEQYYRMLMILTMGSVRGDKPPTVMDMLRLGASSDERAEAALKLSPDDTAANLFYKMARAGTGEQHVDNFMPYITSKFNRFVADVTLRNMTCGDGMLDIPGVVRDKKILLFNFARGQFGPSAAAILASQLVHRLTSAVMRRGAQQVVDPFFLYVDEFQVIADDNFADMLAECRKFGLALTLAHQYLDQIPDDTRQSVLGNVGTTIALRVGSKDAEVLSGTFAPMFSKDDLASLPNFHAIARSFGRLGQTAFSLKLDHEGPGERGREQRIRQMSLRAHARESVEVAKQVSRMQEET
jgi:energy-coupling factor transporter ATP-binding protein EcfA2